MLILFIIICTLLGQEFFAYYIRLPDPQNPKKLVSPRENFDTFWDGALTIFIMLTNENWN